MADETRVLKELPVFSMKGRPPIDPASWRLRVEGLVERPLGLTLEEIHGLPRTVASSEFRCEEGWIVPDNRWEGATIAGVLAVAGLRAEARHVTVHAGEYTAVLSLEDVSRPGVLLAYRRNGAPLPAEHGGPLRLVGPSDWDCFASVKWVERLEVTAEAPEATGPGIALGRIGRAPAL